MDIVIGGLINNTVPVTFTVEGKEPFTRSVNVVRAVDGSYDEAATSVRIRDELAPGVQVKFDLGIIGNPPPVVPQTDTVDTQ